MKRIVLMLSTMGYLGAVEPQNNNYLTVPRIDGKILAPAHHPFRTTYAINALFTITPTTLVDEEQDGPAFIVRIIPAGEPIARPGWVWERLGKWCCCCCKKTDRYQDD